MKQCPNLLQLCAVLLVTPIIVQSQRLTPSYLSEMPAPARVIAEIKGKDPADSGARQLGSFAVLIKIMNDMAYGLEHRSERQLTPDEQRITQQYTNTYTEVWQKLKSSYGNQYHGEYDNDRDLLVEVLDKFFSPNFRAQYLKLNGFAAAWYNKVHANGATSGAASNPNTGSANSPGAGSAAGTDPSIAKARAANVDTKVYGMQLGETLRLPTCTGPSSLLKDHPTCFYEDDGLANEIGTLLGGGDQKKSEDWRLVFVHNGPRAEVLFYNGLLVAVKLGTNGVGSVDRVSEELREKYGPPTLVKLHTYTPRIGNAVKANDLEWRLPGLHVEYTAVLRKPNSTEVVSIDAGSIYVETESAYQRRLAKEKEQEKSRTKM